MSVHPVLQLSTDRPVTDVEDGEHESDAVGSTFVAAGRSPVVLSLVAPALLLIVAATQMAMAATMELTPWKGGGFGMFATIDEPGHRVVEVELSLQGERSTVILTDLDDIEPAASALEAARSLPAEPMLRRAATALDDVRWHVGDGGVEATNSDDGRRGTVEHLRVVRPVVDDNRLARETVASWEPR